MRKRVELLIAWLELRAKAPPPVPGWIMQWLLLVGFVLGWWFDHHERATTFLVGSLVLGVVRQIEAERRKRDGEA